MKPFAISAQVGHLKGECMNLLPCPFCGGQASLYWEDNRECIPCWIECDHINCNGRGPTRETTQEAIDAWNKRHNAPPTIDEVPNLDSQSRLGK